MTVLDTSVIVDYLLGEGVAGEVERVLAENSGAAPDVLVFEVLAIMRRLVARGHVPAERAAGAIQDLGDLSVELYASLPLRERAWSLRENLTAADALFVALAGALEEPLATKDEGLVTAARTHAGVAARHMAATGD